MLITTHNFIANLCIGLKTRDEWGHTIASLSKKIRGLLQVAMIIYKASPLVGYHIPLLPMQSRQPTPLSWLLPPPFGEVLGFFCSKWQWSVPVHLLLSHFTQMPNVLSYLQSYFLFFRDK